MLLVHIAQIIVIVIVPFNSKLSDNFAATKAWQHLNTPSLSTSQQFNTFSDTVLLIL